MPTTLKTAAESYPNFRSSENFEAISGVFST
jgi:hypothetical protein